MTRKSWNHRPRNRKPRAMFQYGRLYKVGPIAWRWELSIPPVFWVPPILHFELQLNLYVGLVTVVYSRELR
jgi:hypothetical protein